MLSMHKPERNDIASRILKQIEHPYMFAFLKRTQQEENKTNKHQTPPPTKPDGAKSHFPSIKPSFEVTCLNRHVLGPRWAAYVQGIYNSKPSNNPWPNT